MAALRVVEPEEREEASSTDAEILADALPHLRRLSRCGSLPPAARRASEVLVGVVEGTIEMGESA